MNVRFESWNFMGSQFGEGVPSQTLRELLRSFDVVKVMSLNMGCGVNYYAPVPSTAPLLAGKSRFCTLAHRVVAEMNYLEDDWGVCCTHKASKTIYQYKAPGMFTELPMQ